MVGPLDVLGRVDAVGHAVVQARGVRQPGVHGGPQQLVAEADPTLPADQQPLGAGDVLHPRRDLQPAQLLGPQRPPGHREELDQGAGRLREPAEGGPDGGPQVGGRAVAAGDQGAGCLHGQQRVALGSGHDLVDGRTVEGVQRTGQRGHLAVADRWDGERADRHAVPGQVGQQLVQLGAPARPRGAPARAERAAWRAGDRRTPSAAGSPGPRGGRRRSRAGWAARRTTTPRAAAPPRTPAAAPAPGRSRAAVARGGRAGRRVRGRAG